MLISASSNKILDGPDTISDFSGVKFTKTDILTDEFFVDFKYYKFANNNKKFPKNY